MSNKNAPPRDLILSTARKAVAPKHNGRAVMTPKEAFTLAFEAIGKNPNFAGADGRSIESLETELRRTNNADTAATFDSAGLSNALLANGIPASRVPGLVQECFDIMDGKSRNVSDVVLAAGKGADIALGSVLGGGGLRGLAESANPDGSGMSKEAWGPDINRLESDERTSFSLAIMRTATSVEDKLFGRVPVTENTIALRYANPVVYDFAASNKTIETIKTADPIQHSYIDLQKDPRPINSAPKPMVPNPDADVDGVLFKDASGNQTTLLTVGTNCNYKKLCLQAGVFGYDQYNLTDLIAEGGTIKTVRILVTDGTSKEYYDLAATSMRKSTYVRSPQGENSGDVSVNMNVPFVLNAESVDITGTATKLGAQFTNVYVTKPMTLSSTLNLMYGDLTSSASNGVNEVTSTDGSVVSDTLVQAAKKLQISVVAFDPGLSWDESNFRKSNMALMVNYGQNKVAMPRPINFFTDYALGQEDDQNVVEATSGVMNLGNSFRTLSIASGAMSDVAQATQYVQETGVDVGKTTLADMSLTHTMVRPIVFTSTLDFSAEPVNTMDESTRIKQVSGRLMNRLIPMIADVIAQSLIGLTYKDGEQIVFKVLAHSYLADVLFGLYDYFPVGGAKPEELPVGSSFSIPLPNGIRLDVVKVVWKTMESKIALFPAKDGDSTDLTNFGVIYSRGIASFMFNPTFDSATFRRCVSCQRELFVPTTIVALAVKVIGLATQLGSYGYDPIDLVTQTAAEAEDAKTNRTVDTASDSSSSTTGGTTGG